MLWWLEVAHRRPARRDCKIFKLNYFHPSGERERERRPVRIPRHCQISQLKWDLSDFLLLMLGELRTVKYNIWPSSNRLQYVAWYPRKSFEPKYFSQIVHHSTASDLLNRMVNVSTQLSGTKTGSSPHPLVFACQYHRPPPASHRS